MLGRLRHGLLLAALLGALVLAAAATGCGSSEETHVSEGVPVKVGELTYNVQLSRFLNIADNEDHFYLSDQKPLPAAKYYFGVFVQIKNSADSPQAVPRDLSIVDTLGNRYSPRPSKSDFALALGGQIPAKGSVPAPDSPARSGPTEGSLILFVVNHDITENRPLNLIVPGSGNEQAEIKLDI
ncbi:MAG: hypothetical protein QOG26_548 [Solirubrobacterales bacterium]|nr:hypothetical protein [Solirubrobacterales bacterium]